MGTTFVTVKFFADDLKVFCRSVNSAVDCLPVCTWSHCSMVQRMPVHICRNRCSY